MTQKTFTPEKGQFFWYIKEVEERGLPNLKAVSSKYDPEKHNTLIETGNCFLTEFEAYDSLT